MQNLLGWALDEINVGPTVRQLHIHMHMHIKTHVYTYIYIYTYVYVDVCLYVHIYIYTYIYMGGTPFSDPRCLGLLLGARDRDPGASSSALAARASDSAREASSRIRGPFQGPYH